ncbi:MAG: hypothetical protein Q8921_09575 [Bacteroidota bacterium]|nr:hypothetical protein [Bacteroidota bacterium]
MRSLPLILGLSIVALGWSYESASAQKPLPLAGQSFTFGIIEGPENLPGADTTSSALTLTIVSPFSGSGTIASPSGYRQDFTFSAVAPTILTLPENLKHSLDLGRTFKGLRVHTSEPVSLTLHDYVLEAGDATQLYPDEVLDTSYVVAEWGLWDDVGEQNHNEILVTSLAEGTRVTITPSVETMLGQPAGVPFSIQLNAGECYIVKADTSGQPFPSSLANSIVEASNPVSVIVGTTCAYVPLAAESCNELMDEILGKSHWGTHFFIAPLGNDDGIVADNVRAMLTSDRPFNYTVNGIPGFAPGNRAVLSFSGPAEITTAFPAELHELAAGSSQVANGISDPTLVTVLDTTLWSTMLLWNAPVFVSSYPFFHYASIIYPSASESMIRLDGQPITALTGSRATIGGSSMTAMVASVSPGMHILSAPVPIFAIASGWQSADSYSFLPGTLGTYVQPTQSVSSDHPVHSRVNVSPNPAFGSVAVYLSSDDRSTVDVSIVNILGIEVAHLFSGELNPGEHSFTWDATQMPSGIYECIVRINKHTYYKSLLLER